MSKFTFIQEYQGFGSPKSTIEFEADQLGDVVEYFTQFLRGCGYHIDGHLEIVNDYEENYPYPKASCTSESDQKEDLDLYTENLFKGKKSLIRSDDC